jgi:CubicO group peptidase (beta-lactamase class C family)
MTMTKRPVLLAGLAGFASSLLSGCAQSAAAAPAPGLVGDWTGILGGPGGLRLRLSIAADGAVTLYSLDQGGAPIPTKAEALASDDIRIQVPAVKGRLTGKLVGDEIQATWTQGRPRPLLLKRGEAGLVAAAVAALTTEALAGLRAQSGSPAIAAMAQARGGTARGWVDGLRRANAPNPATLEDFWHIGSITKSMTATLVARLVEQGAVAWTDTVASRLSAKLGAIPQPYADASFLHLMSHHAGLSPNFPMLQLIAFHDSTADVRDDRLKWASQAFKQKPTAALGKPGGYSNSGFIIAGAMLEQATGESWEALIAKHVFQPLGMTRAGFGAPVGDQPWGHGAKLMSAARNPIEPDATADNPAVLGPAGRVHLPLADLIAFLRAHAYRPAFLSAASWDRLHTPPFGGNGALGLIVRDGGQLWHNGSNTMWYAEIAIEPATGKVAAAAANDGVLDKSQPAVATALAGALAAV